MNALDVVRNEVSTLLLGPRNSSIFNSTRIIGSARELREKCSGESCSRSEIRHALRMTLRDSVLARSFDWPARHAAGGDTPGGIPFASAWPWPRCVLKMTSVGARWLQTPAAIASSPT